MYQHRTAYRHEHGVEGYVGTGTTAAAATADARRKVRVKCEALGAAFDAGRLLTTAAGMTDAEKAQLHADWLTSARSTLC